MEHSQLIQANFVSYLSGITPSPWQEDMTDASGTLRIFAGQDTGTKDSSRITCAVTGDLTEEPQFSGNRWADVDIQLKTPVVDDGGASFALHQLNAAALQSALMDTGFEAGLQSSALYVYRALDRNPYQEEDGDWWLSGMKMRIYSIQTA